MDPEDNTNEAQEAQEWAQATQDFAEDNDVKIDTPEKPEEKEKEKEEVDVDKDAVDGDSDNAKTGDSKDEGEKPEADEKDADKTDDKPEEKPEEAPPVENPVSSARATQRQLAQDEADMKSDIKEKMFEDTPTELLDADGDPIRTIEDVMKLMNPNTRKPFTEEQAASYLLQAQRHLDSKIKQMDSQVEQIAQVNLTIKDETESVMAEYGELLKSMPGLRTRVWKEFEKTLVKDNKSGIITKAPVSVKGFYDTVLAPYAKYAEKLEKEASERESTETKEKEETEKKEKEVKKSQENTDREDIFSTGKSDTMDPEEKEWAGVAKDYYKNN